MLISDWSSDVCSSDLQGARRVARIADMRAAGQAIDQIGFDRPDREPVAGLAKLRPMLQRPADLGAGEIGVDQQAAFRLPRLLVPRSLQPGAVETGRAARRERVGQDV